MFTISKSLATTQKIFPGKLPAIRLIEKMPTEKAWDAARRMCVRLDTMIIDNDLDMRADVQ